MYLQTLSHNCCWQHLFISAGPFGCNTDKDLWIHLFLQFYQVNDQGRVRAQDIVNDGWCLMSTHFVTIKHNKQLIFPMETQSPCNMFRLWPNFLSDNLFTFATNTFLLSSHFTISVHRPESPEYVYFNPAPHHFAGCCVDPIDKRARGTTYRLS